jgi:hypothetical protein
MAKSEELRLSTMNDFSSRHYDNDEVNRIIRRALKLKNEDTISHQDLIDTARDIGLDPQIVETAIITSPRGRGGSSGRFWAGESGWHFILKPYFFPILENLRKEINPDIAEQIS